jgi:hypothetical protein
MSDWRILLREADRALGPDDQPDTAQRVRRSVLASVAAGAVAGRGWSGTFAVTAATLALMCVALLTALQSIERTDPATMKASAHVEPAMVSPDDVEPSPDRQQLHFSTPGGTRIIWVFDPGFEVKGTLP